MEIEKLQKEFSKIQGIGNNLIYYYNFLEFECTPSIYSILENELDTFHRKNDFYWTEKDGAIFHNNKDNFTLSYCICSSNENNKYLVYKISQMQKEYKEILLRHYREVKILSSTIDKEYANIEDLLYMSKDEINKIIKSIKDEIKFSKKNLK